jgi:hypothetical protein
MTFVGNEDEDERCIFFFLKKRNLLYCGTKGECVRTIHVYNLCGKGSSTRSKKN